MECTIDWLPANGMAFSAETGSGHLLTMDGAPDGGGRNLAPRPMETVLAGTGACSAYDVVLILQARPPRRARLPGQGRRPSARRGSEGVHAHPSALRRHRRAARARRGRAGDRAVAREVLLGDDHARQDGRRSSTSYEIVAAERVPAATGSDGSARSGSSPARRARIAQRDRPAAAGAAPARSAAIAWPASSAFICATIARDAMVAGGQPRRGGSSRWRSTWRSVSTTKPRLTASPSAARRPGRCRRRRRTRAD